jgi:hypothetical protein
VTRTVACLALFTAGWLLSGCTPFGDRRGANTASSKLAQAQVTHEYPSGPPPAQSTTGGASTPVQAVWAFAQRYINWDSQTVAADMQSLAAQSIGQARSAVSLAAAKTAQDYELQRGGIANSGTVEAVAPLIGHAGQYVVVTREQTTATNTSAYQGLAPAWHLAVATVTELVLGNWVVSGWRPES